MARGGVGREVPDGAEKLRRGLDLGHVAGGRKKAEPGAGDGRGVGTPVVRVNDPVAVAPDHQQGTAIRPSRARSPGSVIVVPP